MSKLKVGVVGLGYVGLPLACLCANKGYHVVGFDINEEIVGSLIDGVSHIRDDSVEISLSKAIDSGRFHPTSNTSSLKDCSIYLICVPTPIKDNFEPNLGPLEGAINSISPCLTIGDLVVVESTVFPGTCEEVIMPLLELQSGLSTQGEIKLAHCPERVNPGDSFWNSENIPRVIGALDRIGLDQAAEFYASILGGEIVDVRDIRAALRPKFTQDNDGKLDVAHAALGSVTKMRTIRDAEAVKAMENTVRDVNIALVNELAKISDVLGLDVVDIVDGMSTKPFGKGPFYPGAGVGGHCIAVDPEWLKAASVKAGYMPEIIQLARTTNNEMPTYTISILKKLLKNFDLQVQDSKVAILGVSYKRNVDDSRESPFYELRDLLLKESAEVSVYDSWISVENTSLSLGEVLTGCDAVLIVTDHSDMIDELKSIDLLSLGIKVLVDGRNCIDAANLPSTILYQGIGRSR